MLLITNIVKISVVQMVNKQFNYYILYNYDILKLMNIKYLFILLY